MSRILYTLPCLISLFRFLFKVLDISEDESQRHLSTATDIVTCISEADTWERNRKALREAAVQVSTDIRLIVSSWSSIPLESKGSNSEYRLYTPKRHLRS